MSAKDYLMKESDVETKANTLEDIDNLVDAQLARFSTAYQDTELDKPAEVKLETGTPVYEFDLQEEKATDTAPVAEKKAGIELSLRTKLIAGVVAVTLILLATLLIYNAVVINRLKADVAYNTEVLQVEESRLDSLIEQVNNASSSSPEQLGLRRTSNVKLNNLDKLLSTDITKDSNWFDAICQFFSNAFGG